MLAERKDLCLKCHNKSVRANGKPIINIANLMNKGKVKHPPFEECDKTCHNPHAAGNVRRLNSPFPENNYTTVTSDAFKLCWECHVSDMIDKATTTDATSFRNGDKNLHFIHINGKKGRSCLLCHSPHATENLHLIKDVVKFGNWEFKMNYEVNEKGGACLPSCHGLKTYNR